MLQLCSFFKGSVTFFVKIASMVICCIWIPSSTGSRQSAFQTAVRNETGGWEQMIISGQRLQAESRAAGDTRPQCGVKAAVRLKRCKCEVQSIN